ncbi:MAG TPA: hypothetical protein VFB06_11065 [Streptosporangiaceae bacterium]|nr:hypothetical protein [Streptosporangiaceae bacterium]
MTTIKVTLGPVAETADPVAERFARDTAYHIMKVRRDDGLYRHLSFLRFAPVHPPLAPSLSSFYWFDLVTWPHCLAINGDCGSFMFSRVEDMFGFFRGSRINPDYWAEKVRGETRTRCYSDDKFRQHVTEAAQEAEEDWPGLTQAVERDIFGAYSQWNTEFEDGAREALRDFEYRPSGLAASAEGFRFDHSWEWDLRDWDWQFLWCLHAIQWGISRYDAAGGAS